MSVMNIHECAPLGALVRYKSLNSQPPANDVKAFADWKKCNGVGWLVQRTPPRSRMIWSSIGTIVLQQGWFPMDIDTAIAARAVFPLDSDLTFEIIGRPAAGNVRVLQEYGGNSILMYLADNMDDAQRWVEESRHINVRLEEVCAEEICADVVEGRAAPLLEGRS